MWRKTLIAVLLSSSGMVSAAPMATDGCAELARVVFDEVQSSALWGPGRSGPWVIAQGHGDIRECKTVAKTVSRAFTQAMSSVGHTVTWPRSAALPLFDDQICDSVIMNQCIPDPGGEPVPRTIGINPVGAMWKAVSFTVMQQMYNPYSSNEVRFNADDLRLRLGLALRNTQIGHRAVNRSSDGRPNRQ